jgi:hypothetical protein
MSVPPDPEPKDEDQAPDPPPADLGSDKIGSKKSAKPKPSGLEKALAELTARVAELELRSDTTDLIGDARGEASLRLAFREIALGERDA